MAEHVEPLFDEDEIADCIDRMAADIAADNPQDLMIIALLKGSFVFAADLIRSLHEEGMRPQIDFMSLSSYGDDMQSCGTVTIHRDISDAVEGREVLIIDDILETGRTLACARKLIRERGAARVRVAVLLHKPNKEQAPVKADYVGFTIDDSFVVGYGLDYANYYRELPYIGVLHE